MVAEIFLGLLDAAKMNQRLAVGRRETFPAGDFRRLSTAGARRLPRRDPGRCECGGKPRRSAAATGGGGRSQLVFSFRHRQHALHYCGKPVPIRGGRGELFTAAPGDGIKLGFAIVVGNAPLGANPAALLQPDQ
jgi:hypothetical protein